jgi:hypothetical protein
MSKEWNHIDSYEARLLRESDLPDRIKQVAWDWYKKNITPSSEPEEIAAYAQGYLDGWTQGQDSVPVGEKG